MSEDFASIGMQIDTTDLNRANTGLDQFGRKVKGAQDKSSLATKAMEKGFKSVHLAVTGALSALLSVGAAVGTIRQFETSMSQVSAVSRATTAELQKMRDVAKDLGSTTEFTAAQAADGLRFLAMAGFSASEAMQAIPAVLDLATASAMGLAEAADIASNVISGFGLEAGAAAEVADVLAAASSRANTNVAQLGRAMSTVAPISAALGIDLADTASAIGVLSDAGIQGERAGTALRGVLASLAGPTTQAQAALANYGLTVADVNPETRALTEIFGELRERGLSTADAMVIFGREAASGALVLTEASERVGSFGEELRNVEGAASDMASIMRDNLAGSANTALSALQGLAVAIGEAGLTAALRAGLEVVTNFARKLTSLTVAVSEFFTRHDPMAESVAAAAVAMNEEAKQALQLSNRLLEMGEVSYDVLGAKTALVETTLRQIEADRQANIMAVKQTEEYERLQQRINHAREALDVYADLARAGIELNEEQALSLSGMTEVLRDAVARQQEMVEAAGEVGPKYEQAVAELNLLKAYLADAEGNTVTIGENIEDVGEGLNFAQRVAQFLDGYVASVAGNADAAAGSVSSLNSILASAAATARALAGAMASAASVLGPLGSALSSLGGGGLLGRVTGGLGGVLGNIVNSDAIDAAGNRLARLGNTMQILFERSKAAAVAQDTFASSVGSAGGAAGGAAKKVEDFADEIERLEDAADPTRKFVREMEKLDQLRALENGLSDGAYAQGVRDLNEELVNSTPLLSSMNDAFGQMVDYMFDGFKDGMKGILNIFVNTLKQMAAMAIKNRITLSIGAAFSGGAGAAAAGVPGGGGILNNILGLGGSGGALSGIGSGLMGVFSGGGLGSSFANLGGLLSGSVSGWGAVGAALPAAGLLVGVPLLLGALFKKTEVLVAEGVRARIEGASLELDSYEKTKTNNGLGISSGFDREFTRLDDAVQSAVQTRLDATITALEQFGFGVDLTGFSFSKRTEIKDGETFEGETEEVIREALDKVVTEFTDGALAIFQNAGESISETLDRMTNSLTLANESLDFFGGTLLPISLDGAAAAAALTDLYGGLEAFAASGQFLFENFTTTEQKLERATAELNAAFEQLGVDVPKTHQAYLDLINSQDILTDRGRELHAGLSALAPLFTAVAGTADEAAEAAAAAAEALAEYEAGLQESIRLRAEEKTAMLEANKALRDAQRATERREEIEARRAAQEVEFAKAQEAFADTVPLLAKQVSIGLLTIEQAAGGFGEEAVKQIEDAIGNMSALDLINARFNDPVYENGQGNLRLTGFEVFARAQQDVRDKFQSVAAGLIEPFEGLAQRVGAGIAGVNGEFGLNINAVQNTIASLESLGNAREGEIEALREVVDEYENTQRTLVSNAAQMSQEIGHYLEMGVSEIVEALGDSAFEQATSSIGQLRDVVNALGGSAANTRVALMELAAAEEAYGVNFDKRKLVVGAALENAEARIAEVVKAPFEAALDTLVPELEALAGQFTTPILGIINEVDADDINSYSDAFVRLTDLFTSGAVGVEAYEQSLSLLDLAMDGFDDGVKASIRGINSSLSEAQRVFDALNAIAIPSDASDPVALGQAFQAMRHAMGGLRYELEQGGEVSKLFEEYLGSVFDFSALSNGDAAAKALEFDDALRGLMNGLEVELAALQPAADGATDAVEGLSDAARELESLQERFNRLSAELAGPEAVQEYEISKLLSDEAKALQRQIYGLEKQLADAAEAARQAEAALQEKAALERRILELNEDTAAIRELELAALDPANRELQKHVWVLEDEAEAAARAEAILQERLGLENQLLQLQGNTAELRRRELEALDPSNRALQEQIYALQDFQDALGGLSIALDAESNALRQSVDDARNALAASLDAETQRLEGVLSGLQSQRDSLYDQLFPQEAEQNSLEIRDFLSDGLDLAKRLSEIARDVLGQNVEIAEQQREAALRQLQGMLAAGAIDVDNVQDIARRASEFNSRQYATLAEMQLDQLVTANTITELSKLQEKLAQEAQAEEDARVAEARELAFDQIDLLDQQIAEQQNALARLDDIRRQNGIAVDTLLSIAEAQVKFDQAQQYAETREAQLEAIRAEFGLLNGTLASGLSEIAAATGQAIQAARDAQVAASATNSITFGGGSLSGVTTPGYNNDVVDATSPIAKRDALAQELYALQSGAISNFGMSREEAIRAIDAKNTELFWAEQEVKKSIPSYANGTDFHPGGWAKLHENEMVNLPRGTSVSTASEVRQMAVQNKRLEQQNEQNAAELRQMRRFLKTLADIEEDRRAEELAKAKAQEEASA